MGMFKKIGTGWITYMTEGPEEGAEGTEEGAEGTEVGVDRGTNGVASTFNDSV